MKLKFIADAFYNGECVFTKGEVKDVKPEDYAARWVRRGLAIVVPEGTKNPEKLPVNPVAPEKQQKPEEKKQDQAPAAPANKPLEQSPKSKQDVKGEPKKVDDKSKDNSLDL